MGKPLQHIETGLSPEQLQQLRKAEQHAMEQQNALAKNKVHMALRKVAAPLSKVWRKVLNQRK